MTGADELVGLHVVKAGRASGVGAALGEGHQAADGPGGPAGGYLEGLVADVDEQRWTQGISDETLREDGQDAVDVDVTGADRIAVLGDRPGALAPLGVVQVLVDPGA